MDEFSQSLPKLSESMIKTAANAITCIDAHEYATQEVLKNLRDNLEKYCKNNEKLKKMNEMSRYIVSQPESNRKVLFDKYVEDIKSFEPDVTNNKVLKEHDNSVAALLQNATGLSQDDTSAGDELQIANNNVNLICPISKTKMTEPMQNKICGHVYDKSSVESLLKMAKRTRCPIVGCSNKEYLDLELLRCDIVTQMCVEADDD